MPSFRTVEKLSGPGPVPLSSPSKEVDMGLESPLASNVANARSPWTFALGLATEEF